MLQCLRRLGCPLGSSRPVPYEAVRLGAPLEALQWLFGHGFTVTDSQLRDAQWSTTAGGGKGRTRGGQGTATWGSGWQRCRGRCGT